MIPVKYEVKDRGPTVRGMRRVINNLTKESWFQTGVQFHARFTDLRFTHAHATQAGYAPRSKSYERQKFKKYGHTYPLEYTGRTRRLVRTANVASTSKGVDIRYPGARVFNFRNPKMKANMVVEFTTVLQSEANEMAKFFDDDLDKRLNSYNGDNS